MSDPSEILIDFHQIVSLTLLEWLRLVPQDEKEGKVLWDGNWQPLRDRIADDLKNSQVTRRSVMNFITTHFLTREPFNIDNDFDVILADEATHHFEKLAAAACIAESINLKNTKSKVDHSFIPYSLINFSAWACDARRHQQEITKVMKERRAIGCVKGMQILQLFSVIPDNLLP